MDFQSLFGKEVIDEIRRDFVYEVQMAAKTLSDQITNRSTRNTSSQLFAPHYFSTNFYTQANELGLTEEDAVAVFSNGQEIKEGVILREYNGYEIGIEYVTEQFSGKPMIIAIWKRTLFV